MRCTSSRRAAYMRPSFTRILQRVRAEMVASWKQCSYQQYSPSERATKILSVAIEELKKQTPPQEHGLSVMRNIRYAIFNYVPWQHFESRTTVSYFNFGPNQLSKDKKLNEKIKNLCDNLNQSDNTYVGHHMLLDKGHDIEHDKFEVIWNNRWLQYLKPINSDQFPSWNEFLLNHSESPVNMGVIWDRIVSEDQHKICGDYTFDASYSGLDFIDVFNIRLDEFVNKFSKSVCQKAVKYIAELREMCCPYNAICNKQWNSIEAISQSLASLYWGFGLWGADSFISIPVTYGSSSTGRTGVLSLGTTKPLEQKDIHKWTLIANCIIGTLLNLEADERILRSTTNYTYRVGHPFKNRANSVSCFARNIRMDFDRLLKDNKDTVPSVIQKKLETHKGDLYFLEKNSEKLIGFGSLVNFLSALLIDENNVWTKERAERWLTSTPINVRRLLQKLAEESFHRDDPLLKLKVEFNSVPKALSFACSVHSSYSNKFLGEELLSAIFYELTVNAIHHGKINSNDEVVLSVNILSKGDKHTLLLTNIVGIHLSQETSNIAEYNIHGAGGETLAGHLLFELISGSPKLLRRTFKEGNNLYFQYQIELELIEST